MRRGDVVYVNLPYPAPGAGREQGGRRPAIVVLSDSSPSGNPMVMIVPITAQLSALRFPYTIRVESSTANGLRTSSALLVFQLRAIDQGRLAEIIGHLEDAYMQQLGTFICQNHDE